MSNDDLDIPDLKIPDVGTIDVADAPENRETGAGLDALRAMNAELETAVLGLVAHKEAMAAAESMPATSDYPLAKRKNEMAGLIAGMFPDTVTANDVQFRDVPPNLPGDFAIMVPSLQRPAEGADKDARAEASRRYIQEYIPRIAEAMKALPCVSEVKQTGMYLNVTLNATDLASDTLGSVEKLGADYGNSDAMRDRRVVVDYSSPNIAKTMHIGHLRSTVIGQVLINLLRSNGAVTYGINHLGDWGTQFGQLVAAYKLWGNEIALQINPEREPIKYLAALYSKIKHAIKDEEGKPEQPLTNEGRANFAKLEAGDPEIVALWKKFRAMSIEEFNVLYRRLGIHHDMALGESFYEDKMPPVIDEVKAHGNIAFQSDDGAWVFNFEDVGLNRAIFLTADQRSVYATRDIAAVRHRGNSFKATDILYVIGTEQKLHMAQVFEASRRLGDLDHVHTEHIQFGMIKARDVGGKLAKIASRDGAGGLSDIIDGLADLAKKRFEGKGLPDDEVNRYADQIGIGALVYSNFTQQKERDMEFDPEKMLSLDNQTAPYLQYACVRMNSLLQKANYDSSADGTPISAEVLQTASPEARKMIEMIAKFPEVVGLSAAKYSPHLLADYLFGLSKSFNSLYSNEKVSDMPEKTKKLYLRIISSVNTVLRKGLALLNIQVPEKM